MFFENTFDQLSRQIAAALETLTFEHHFVWPVWATAIGSNGSMLGLQYRVPGEEPRIVAKHVETPGFALPLNLVFVSSGDGRAANVVIAEPGSDKEVRVSGYRANRGGHAPGHLRDALYESLERYWAGAVPDWTIALADEEVLCHLDSVFQRSWDRWPVKRRARWLLGQLHNCTDIMPGDLCSELELPLGSTVARAARKLRSEMEGVLMENP